jgi:AbrB family looped-hinge helix DNA binding protein
MLDPKCIQMPAMATVTIGTKGQIVIPKDAREVLGVESGDRLVLIAKPDGIMLFPVDQMQSFIEHMQSQLLDGP